MNGELFYNTFEPHDVRFDTHVITGKLQKDVEMSDWNPTTRLFTRKRIVTKGTKVRIVMLSRLGDMGITDQLDKNHGYGSRISPNDIGCIKIKKVDE